MDEIRISGARENNLKNVSVTLPKNKVVVITGLSGSGKSSLVYDTLYAEGQRKYLQSLSSNAHQFINQLDRPDVDQIIGLTPTLAINQRQGYVNPRDTVATMADVYGYLSVLYARAGTPHCTSCGREIKTFTLDTVIRSIKAFPTGTPYALLAPMIRNETGDLTGVFNEIRKNGFNRVRLNNEIVDISTSNNIYYDKKAEHCIDIVVDRLISDDDNGEQLADSIEACLKIAKTRLIVLIFHRDGTTEEKGFALSKACFYCDVEYPELQPRSFLFNNPYGACKTCSGVGTILEFDPDKVIPDKKLSFNEGAITTVNPKANWQKSIFHSLSKRYEFSLDTPFQDLPGDIYNIILFGSEEELEISYLTNAQKNKYEYSAAFKGILNDLKKRYVESQSEDTKRWLESFMDKNLCPECQGKRLKPESLVVTINGNNIVDLTAMSVTELVSYIQSLVLSGNMGLIAKEPLKEILARLCFLEEVGLGYLTLDRKATTLSGGEYQRIRLATQIGSALEGVTYILDEPTIGLHPRDNDQIINAIFKLKELGNTVIVVEHDEQTIRRADHIIDMGPGAGINGGEVLFSGSLSDMLTNRRSITGKFLSGEERVEQPQSLRNITKAKIKIEGANIHNLKNISVEFPLGVLTVVTGVSGSGKSTLVFDTLYPALLNKLSKRQRFLVSCKSISGFDQIESVICVDQSPIGKSTRSNPATYLGFFDQIRSLFASLPASKMRGYGNGRFSFNTAGGRCDNCGGMGQVIVKMHFLPDVYVTCDVCKGRRYNEETLSVLYNNKSIYDILEMSVDEAFVFFEKVPGVKRQLTLLKEIGLGYLKIGQSSSTLSGGECQRIKLAEELSKNSNGHTLYLLDEPTTGLHFRDIRNLMQIIHRLVDNGNTIILIEHNLDVIRQADHIIDMGPDGGVKGGEVLFAGCPDDITQIQKSYTGSFLKKMNAAPTLH